MHSHWNAGAALALTLAGCASAPAGGEEISSTSSAIQGGTADTTHTFVVGVGSHLGSIGQVVCTGTLLAPNLVATARHCVAHVSGAGLGCSATFGAATPEGLVVTTDATISKSGHNVTVSKVLTPETTSLCGGDLALLVLAQGIPLSQYAMPVLTPMTDHTRWHTTVTDIGYGREGPSGAGMGVRRILHGVALACIPGDPGFVDCCADPASADSISTAEFRSGDGVCEGDSGSSAFEQRSFDAGVWASLGVLSRGGQSSDGKTCSGSVYTRFDAWGAFVASAAAQAAQAGGYAAPSWATAFSGGGGVSTSPQACSPPSGEAGAPAAPVDPNPTLKATCSAAPGEAPSGGLVGLFGLAVVAVALARRRRA